MLAKAGVIILGLFVCLEVIVMMRVAETVICLLMCENEPISFSMTVNSVMLVHVVVLVLFFVVFV
jgi:hypothetical protein